MESYKLQIAGLTRELELFDIGNDMKIAAFIMFSDVELCRHCAKELLNAVDQKGIAFDIIVTAETKGIPIAYEMSSQSGINYTVARKSVKLYMKDPVKVNVRSITTDAEQTLYFSKKDADMIRGRRVLIADDVISTGESLRALEKLIEEVGGTVVAKAAALAEGKAADREDLIYLEKLPLFDKDGNAL